MQQEYLADGNDLMEVRIIMCIDEGLVQICEIRMYRVNCYQIHYHSLNRVHFDEEDENDYFFLPKCIIDYVNGTSIFRCMIVN